MTHPHARPGSLTLLAGALAAVLVGCAREASPPRDASVDVTSHDAVDATSHDAVDATPSRPPAVRPPPRCEDGAATPLAQGRRELDVARGQVGSEAPVTVAVAADDAAARALAGAGITLSARAGSYAMLSTAERTWVVGRDEVGAMYGAFELAERLRREHGAALPLRAPVTASPRTDLRAANLFLTVPERGEAAWWFHDPTFWCEYLDLMARARMNVLDLHGMYNPRNTLFPNALLYFARSAAHPGFGVPEAERARNLATLARVVEMARARGIRVALMTYRSDVSTTGDPPPGAPVPDDVIRAYTREAVTDLARRVPGLWKLGFRIGESQHDADWYVGTFLQGVRDARGSVGVFTRTWGTDKASVLRLAAAAGDDFVVEAKYNGEHLGPPYVVTGGTMATWWSTYSYEDYLTPPTPYRLVFQVRTGGTHRVFRHASYERARRAAGTFSLGGAAGFSLEPPHAFMPQRDTYHADPADRFSPWTFRRDELEYLLYGRLAYDPGTPVEVFRQALAARTGTDALWAPVQAASEVVPWIFTARGCGPDHRHVAPELEWGGPVAWWTTRGDVGHEPTRCGYHGGFDSFALASVHDAVDDLLAGRPTPRLSPVEVARLVLEAAAQARRATAVPVDARNAEARDVVRECVALADLGDYFGHKLRAALALAVHRRAGAPTDLAWLTTAREELAAAHAAWRSLARDTGYLAPFWEPLRMCQFPAYCSDARAYTPRQDFHWRVEANELARDLDSLAEVEREVSRTWQSRTPLGRSPRAWLDARRGEGPGLASLVATPARRASGPWRVEVTFAREVPPGADVRVLWKGFSGNHDWREVTARGAGTRFSAEAPGDGPGAMFAVEVAGAGGEAWRYPDVLRETPYVAYDP